MSTMPPSIDFNVEANEQSATNENNFKQNLTASMILLPRLLLSRRVATPSSSILVAALISTVATENFQTVASLVAQAPGQASLLYRHRYINLNQSSSPSLPITPGRNTFWRRCSSSSHLHKSLLKLNMIADSMNEFKRAKIDVSAASTKVIGTHSGTFQADEAMGCWMLRQLPDYTGSAIVRSRDLDVLEKLDIVIDVGGIYDHSKLRYDHHQRGYDERFDIPPKKNEEGRCTKLSASGLVYRHYGRDVIHQFYPSLSKANLELVYAKLYDSLLEALDAVDTGVEQLPADCGIEMVYSDHTTTLPARVSRLNPRWNEESDHETGTKPDPDQRFEKAMQICGDDFISVLTKIVESDLPARSIVEQSLLNRHKVDDSGEIICFPSGGLPWKNHLYELEKEHSLNDTDDKNKLIKFVLYTDQSGMWRVQAVTVEGKAFENRLSLPEPWRGVRDADLESVTKIPGSKFVHAAGFIGGNETYEGALQMAKVALSF